MRPETVTSLKRDKDLRQQKPREGTKLRTAYDILTNNKGLPVDICLKGGASFALPCYYGLDIRYINKRWILAGEWFGKDYVDYIAQRLDTK